MTTRSFFNYCRDLVGIRWVVWFGNGDGIRLTPIVEYHLNLWEFTRPLSAVAVDKFGFRNELWNEPGIAAQRLELHPEIARLLHTASRSPFDLSPREEEVRAELIDALERGKRFEISHRRRR